MARVTYGSGITEYNGSIGGITYQKNASGNIAKLRSNPAVNPTPLQSIYQTRMAYLVSFWPTLSQANKDLWDAFALLHDHTTPWADIKTLSGYQWFLSCNLKRMLYHSTPISVPPTWAVKSPPPVFTLSYTLYQFTLSFYPVYYPDTDLIIYCSLPLKQSSLKLRRSLFLVKIIYNSIGYAIIDIMAEVEALIGMSWADFISNVDCNLIVRVQNGEFDLGLFSSYTSAIKKIT